MSLTVNPGTITAKLRLAPNFSMAASTQKEVATSIEDRLRQLDIQNILKESSTPPKKDKFKVTVLRDGTILKSQEGAKTQRLGTMDATALFNKFHLNPMPTSPSSDHDSYEVHTSPATKDANSATASQDTGSLTIHTTPNGAIQHADNSPSSHQVNTSPPQVFDQGFLAVNTSPSMISSNPTNSITAHTNPLNQSRRGQPHDNDSAFDDGRDHQQESFIVNTSPLSRSNPPQTFATIQTIPPNPAQMGTGATTIQTTPNSSFQTPHHLSSSYQKTQPFLGQGSDRSYYANHTNPLHPTGDLLPRQPTHPQFSPRQQTKDGRRDSSHSDSNDHGASYQPYSQMHANPELTSHRTSASAQLSMHLPYGDHDPLINEYFTIMMNRSCSEDLLFLIQTSFEAFNKELITKDNLIQFLQLIKKSNKDTQSLMRLRNQLHNVITNNVIKMYSNTRQELLAEKQDPLTPLEQLFLQLLNLLFEAHKSNAISSETLAEYLLHIRNCTTFDLSDEEAYALLIDLLKTITTSDSNNTSTFIETTTTKTSSTQPLSAPPYKHLPTYDQLQATNTRRPHIASEQPISKAQFQNHLMDIIAPVQDVSIYKELHDYITSQLETSTQSFEQLKNTVIAKVRAHLITISTPKTQNPHTDSDTQTDVKIGSKPYRDTFQSVNFGLPDNDEPTNTSPMTMHSFSSIRSSLTASPVLESDTSSTISRFSRTLPFDFNTQQAASTQTDTASEPSLSKQQMKTLLLGIISVIEHKQLHTSLSMYINHALEADNPDYENLKNRIIHEIKTYYTMPLSRREHIRALTKIIAPIAHLPDEYETLSNVIRTELSKPNVDFEQLENEISERVTAIFNQATTPRVSLSKETQTADEPTLATQTSIIEPTDVHVQYARNTSADSSYEFATEQEHRDYLATLGLSLAPLEKARELYSELKQQAKQGSILHEKRYYLDLYKFLDTPVPEGLAHMHILFLEMIESASLDTEKQRSDFLSHMHTTYPSYYGIKSPQSQEKPLSSKAMTPPTGVNNNTKVDELPTQVVSSNPPSFSQEVRTMNARAAIKFSVLDGRIPKITNLEYCLLQYTKNPNATTRLTISEEIVNLRKNQESDDNIFAALSAKYPGCFPIQPSNP